jgi:hypothetical protein
MALRLPKKWNVFADGKPGRRFQDRYHANRNKRSGLLHRVLHMVLALAAAAIGVVLVFIPGPAIVFFFIAGAFLASDWLWMARTLDWLEVHLRTWGKRLAKKWRTLPMAARMALLAAGGCLSIATTYGAYRLMQ